MIALPARISGLPTQVPSASTNDSARRSIVAEAILSASDLSSIVRSATSTFDDEPKAEWTSLRLTWVLVALSPAVAWPTISRLPATSHPRTSASLTCWTADTRGRKVSSWSPNRIVIGAPLGLPAGRNWYLPSSMTNS